MTRAQILAYGAILILVILAIFISLVFDLRVPDWNRRMSPSCLSSITGPDSRCSATQTAIVARQTAVIATQTAAAHP